MPIVLSTTEKKQSRAREKWRCWESVVRVGLSGHQGNDSKQGQSFLGRYPKADCSRQRAAVGQRSWGGNCHVGSRSSENVPGLKLSE